jgi:hypothetical protein
MGNTVHEKLGVPVTYVVSNPSSYAYLDATRPNEAGTAFSRYSAGRNCTTFDQWPYGIQNRTGYTAKLTDDQLKKQLASRPVVYLLGELDTTPLAGFDSSCPAMAQGPSRLARGQARASARSRRMAPARLGAGSHGPGCRCAIHVARAERATPSARRGQSGASGTALSQRSRLVLLQPIAQFRVQAGWRRTIPPQHRAHVHRDRIQAAERAHERHGERDVGDHAAAFEDVAGPVHFFSGREFSPLGAVHRVQERDERFALLLVQRLRADRTCG